MLLTGTRGWVAVWIGETVSTLGSVLTAFALGVWVYQTSRSTTLFAVTLVSAVLPPILLGPFAGALVDRRDLRSVLIVCNLLLGSVVACLCLVAVVGALQVWHVYAATFALAIVGTVHWPAYEASTTLLVDRAHLGRAAGLAEFGGGAAQVVGPLLAAQLVSHMVLHNVLLIDVGTFGVASLGVALTAMRSSAAPREGRASVRSLLIESRQGWTQLATYSSLVALLAFVAVVNFSIATNLVLITPRVLSIAPVTSLGLVGAAAGFGTVLGSIGMGIWGGPSRRVAGIVAAAGMFGCALIIVAAARSATIIALGVCVLDAASPVLVGCYHAIIQTKIPFRMQGRVLGVVRACALAPAPIAFILAGPIADHVISPLMRVAPKGPVSLFGLVDAGPGASAAALTGLMGVAAILAATVGRFTPRLWQLEQLVPDVI